MAPSRISNVGECGKKSFPTKKHMKIKSSNIRSGSSLNGVGATGRMSNAKYSRKTLTLSNWYGLRAMATFFFVSSVPSPSVCGASLSFF